MTKNKTAKTKNVKNAVAPGKRGRPSVELSFKGLGNKNGEFTVHSVLSRYKNSKSTKEGGKRLSPVAISSKLKKMVLAGEAHVAGKLVKGAGRPWTVFKLGPAPVVAQAPAADFAAFE